MRKFTIGLVATATVVACLSPVTVRATGTTTGGDSVGTIAEPTVPTECIEYFEFAGPARATHSPTGEVIIDVPDCADIEGICVDFVFPGFGPSRAPHGRVELPLDPCLPIDPACDITVELDPPGPARAAHQPTATRPQQPGRFVIVDIPQACQDVLSAVAIPTTGSDSSNIIWLGAVLVGIGAVLLTTRRVATVRAR
jgi:LPXTG-motif cell wall-anchored protein